MIPQQFPLYAIDTRDRKAYVVIGWWVEPLTGVRMPTLAPHDEPGCVAARPLDELRFMVYGTEPPKPRAVHLPFPKPTAPANQAGETVVLKS